MIMVNFKLVLYSDINPAIDNDKPTQLSVLCNN